MNIFIELKNDLNELIDSYISRIYDIEKELNKHNEIKKIINIINSGKDVYLSQVKRIGYYYNELNDYIMLLQEIETIMKSIKNGYFKEVIPDRLRLILQNADIKGNEIVKVMNDFDICDKLNNYYKYEFSDSRIKNIIDLAYENLVNYINIAYQDIFGKLVDEIRNRYNSLSKTDLLIEQKEKLNNYLEKVKRINSSFNDTGMIHELSEDDLAYFYEWLKTKYKSEDSSIIVTNIIKFQKVKMKEDVIHENWEKVMEKMNNIVLSSKNPFKNIDLSEFSEEEKSIILEVQRIYQEMSKIYTERIKFDDQELLDRKESYYHNKIEWEIVLADIENNLLPNIINNKDFVIKIFKLIKDMYYKYEVKESKYNACKKKVQIIKIYLHDLDKILDIDDLYDSSLDELITNNVPFDDPRYNDRYYYYNIRYFLRNNVIPFKFELQNELEKISKIINSDIDNYNDDILNINELKNKFESIMKKYSDIYEKYIIEKEELENEEMIDDNKERKANLVFCLHEVSFENKKENDEEQRKAHFKDTVRNLHNRQFTKMTNEEIHTIGYPSPTQRKKILEFDDTYFTPYRYKKNQDNYRTGFIHFKICSENKEKLKMFYNLEDEYAVLVPFMSVHVPKGDHKEYEDFVKYIRTNMKYLEKIGKKFQNPKTDINELRKMIDTGLEIKENIIKDGDKVK